MQSVTRLRNIADRIFYFDVPKRALYCYVIVLISIYVFVVGHTPLTIYPTAPHDDDLYMSMGRYLSEGKWLGPFNVFTLMKGPGYPAFLAVGNWLGISVTLAHALFHSAVVVIFVWVAHWFIQSHVISGVLFALLLWHPAPIGVLIGRILRDKIYFGQALLVLALLAYALFYPRENKRRNLVAALAGVALGWFWLTREESVWILPGIGVLVAAATFYCFPERRFRALARTFLVLVGVFAATQVGFRTVNWWAYGKFVGVDEKETNFQRALGALQSVRSGGVKPFVSLTRAARERIYPVSPTFASLSIYLDTPPDQGWNMITCNAQPASCGEIGAGWFMFAFRGAAATIGHYESPAKASAFFGRIADEVTAACANGTLECAPQLVAEMPPWTWAQVLDGLPQRYLDALNLLLLLNPPVHFNPSTGTEELLAPRLRFLNYPPHTPSRHIPTSIYTLAGWYYKAGDQWILISVRDATGSLADVRIDRRPSPDIEAAAKREGQSGASHQRFLIRVHCSDDCVLQVQTPEGEKLERTIAQLGTGLIGFPLGKGHFQIESTTAQPNAFSGPPSAAENLASRIRVAVVTHYKFVFIPALILGLIAFLAATVLHWRKAPWNVCYVLALAFWLLALSRATVLILVAATSFPALSGAYFAPAYFMVIAGAAFSVAAWLQLSGRGPSSPELGISESRVARDA